MVVVDASWDPAITKIDFMHNHSGFCDARFVQRADYMRSVQRVDARPAQWCGGPRPGQCGHPCDDRRDDDELRAVSPLTRRSLRPAPLE